MDRSFFPTYYQFLQTPDISEVVIVGAVTTTYLGYWKTGPASIDPLADANWQIKRVTENSVTAITTTEYADGSQAFDKVWNDRAAYAYSFEK
jgi:hypothetical protein